MSYSVNSNRSRERTVLGVSSITAAVGVTSLPRYSSGSDLSPSPHQWVSPLSLSPSPHQWVSPLSLSPP